MEPTQRIELPNKLLPVFTGESRYRCAYGGRGSSKSWTFARQLVMRSMQQYNLRVLCTRELQKSIKDSVHALIKGQVEALGVAPWFDIGEAYIRNAWGAEFLFYGLRINADQIKSLEGIDIAWNEEAHATTEESWKYLIPTIRKPGSEIWCTWNPDQETDPTHRMFVLEGRRNAKVVEMNYHDNPWFGEPLKSEMEELREKDYDAYEHIWLGVPKVRGENQINAVQWIVAALNRPHFLDDGSLPWLRISVDVADGGRDGTVITVAKHYQHDVDVLSMTEHRWPTSVAVIAAADESERIAKRHGFDPNTDDFVVDALGVGAGTAGELMKRGHPVIGYKGGDASDDPAGYRNRRVQSHLGLRDALRDGTIHFHEGAIGSDEDECKLKRHLLAIKRAPGQDKVEDIETKEQLLKREKFSTDWADSLAMQYATQLPTRYGSGDWEFMINQAHAA